MKPSNQVWLAMVLIWLLAGLVQLGFMLSHGGFDLLVYGAALASPGLAALTTGTLLTLCKASEPQTVAESVLVAAMHMAATVTVAVFGSEANPQITLDPHFREMLLWLNPTVLAVAFSIEVMGLVWLGRAASQR